MDNINKTAARFREVRTLLGITQQEMANRLRIKRNTVAKIETGHTQPSARLLSSVEEMLNKSNSQKVDIILVEPKATRRTADHELLRAEIRQKVEAVLDAAGDDPVRLGWVLLQLNEHVKPQKHWDDGQTKSAPDIEEKLEELKREARRTGRGGDSAHAESA